ncbi:PhzF family phenazine biosynthesis protein [Xenorhabdus sp. PB30.3]|uniref:PhzF family phenazine biosynthesis protein n=1 Tax=Xenorhabdus sp. PB30.3 TaxID=2788941 RepID=UPI001E37FBE7|nr:PhzF family phenazine biosynthesis protein [Xenorhabdus sp. PB30.3]MCC8380069.1 PhzF family phenazine biosynthesis protein [Xenorhabdus sp. PB30.3]
MKNLIPELIHIAAFSDNGQGGNPAGVYIGASLPVAADMQRIATEVGFSETAFAAPVTEDNTHEWKVRYFSPEAEVPFCGHATIATGVALARRFGKGEYKLHLNQTNIHVSGWLDNSGIWQAALQSPLTRSQPASRELVEKALALFGYTVADLDPRISPALIHGGADHLVLPLKHRASLASMHYELERGRDLMQTYGWVTILLVYVEEERIFHTRNPFAYGGVYEDPATGAATAAFAGYLRDIRWPHNGSIDLIQGEDMGMRSRIRAEITDELGGSIRVSGQARLIQI